jgi:DNA-directed RNA polymerase subunit E'/Rpb7
MQKTKELATKKVLIKETKETKETKEEDNEQDTFTSTSKNNIDDDVLYDQNNEHKDKKDSELYKNVILDEFIYLKAADLNNKIDDIILLKLQKKIEGKCIKIGYVMPNSVKIVMRSLGIINNANFDGVTTYKVKYTADICNPVIGQIVKCEVGNIDKSQTICYVDTPDTPATKNKELSEKSPIEIYLFKHHHLGNTEFAQLQKGDIINVKIGGSKWEYRDKQIISIAQYVNKV